MKDPVIQDKAYVRDAQTEPMPKKIGDLIKTNKGTRHLLADEYTRGIGVPKDWMPDQQKVTAVLASNTTNINIWEAAGAVLHTGLTEGNKIAAIPVNKTNEEVPVKQTNRIATSEELGHGTNSHQANTAWSWTPTDYSKRGQWYDQACKNLKEVTSTTPITTAGYEQGLVILDKCG